MLLNVCLWMKWRVTQGNSISHAAIASETPSRRCRERPRDPGRRLVVKHPKYCHTCMRGSRNSKQFFLCLMRNKTTKLGHLPQIDTVSNKDHFIENKRTWQLNKETHLSLGGKKKTVPQLTHPITHDQPKPFRHVFAAFSLGMWFLSEKPKRFRPPGESILLVL